MSETRMAPRITCGQHRRPLSECEDWDKHNHSMRFREDDWVAANEEAEASRMPTTTDWVAHGVEVMLGRLRCGRGACRLDAPAVPVTFGDLTGKTLGEWITEAVKKVNAQHPDHEPVLIGVPWAGMAPAMSGPVARPVFREPPAASDA